MRIIDFVNLQPTERAWGKREYSGEVNDSIILILGSLNP